MPNFAFQTTNPEIYVCICPGHVVNLTQRTQFLYPTTLVLIFSTLKRSKFILVLGQKHSIKIDDRSQYGKKLVDEIRVCTENFIQKKIADEIQFISTRS